QKNASAMSAILDSPPGSSTAIRGSAEGCRSGAGRGPRANPLVELLVLRGDAVPRPVLAHARLHHLAPVVGPAAIEIQGPLHGLAQGVGRVGEEAEAGGRAVGQRG